MWILHRMDKCSPGVIECEIERGKVRAAYKIRTTEIEDGLRTMKFVNLGVQEQDELENSDEFRAFTRVLWGFVDGQMPELPATIVSDWKVARGQHPMQ